MPAAVQGPWNWDSLKENISTLSTSSDRKIDPPPKIEACLPFYPVIKADSRKTSVPV